MKYLHRKKIVFVVIFILLSHIRACGALTSYIEAIKSERRRRRLRWWCSALLLQIIQYTILFNGRKIAIHHTYSGGGNVYISKWILRRKTNHRRWSASYFLLAFSAHISGSLQNHLSLEWTNNNISTDVFMLMIWWNEWNFLLTVGRRGKTFSQHLTCYSIAAQQRTPSTG